MARYNITLHEFLMLFINSDFTDNMSFNIINTNNKSFPEKYRFSHEVASTFWANIYKEGDPDKLLDRKIDFINLLPNRLNPYKKLDFELIYDYDRGFLGPFIDKESNMQKYMVYPPAIHITLEPEEPSDKSE